MNAHLKSDKEFDYSGLAITAGQVFNPNTPVSEKDMFLGRTEQIRRIVDVVFQKGQHAVIFGERGVGKTSIANVLTSFVSTSTLLIFTRVNCDSGDSFASLWNKVFEGLSFTVNKPGIGFRPQDKVDTVTLDFLIKSPEITSNDVRKALVYLDTIGLPLIVIDEFDRLDENVRRLFADLIKSLSDHALASTIVLIGVGSSIEDLINEHQSVHRALVQVQMPRMAPAEIKAIITNAMTRLGMTTDLSILDHISLLSKGLPHYTHLIGLHATRDALDQESLYISGENFKNAINKSIKDSQHSIKTNYHRAIKSAHKNSLFAQVLLACALAQTNELGEFAAQDIRGPLLKITGKNYGIPHFAQHLNEFSEEKRGKILQKTGERRFFRYKFDDPLMQPFIIMQGILDKRIEPDVIDHD